MALDTAGPHILTREDNAQTAPSGARGSKSKAASRRIFVSNSLNDVEQHWEVLEEQGIDSPAQSFEFTKVWIETFGIPATEQVFVAAELDGKPLALLALRRKRLSGARTLVPFAGSHVGCHAPLVDKKRFADLDAAERTALWRDMVRAIKGADLIYLPDVPHGDGPDFSDLGRSVASDMLYRTEFTSWEACDREQRSRSRRKHDKQQGAKLAALGAVTYQELSAAGGADQALDVLFRDRAARFARQGIDDPFAPACIRAFYRSIFAQGERLTGQLQTLKLDDEIVAVRYNLVHQHRMYCLISAMSMRDEVQPGSPGKQIMVWLMQSIFGQGIRSFDMGAGFSDEKRHWCNVQIPLRHHYVAMTPAGALAGALHRAVIAARGRIKGNKALFGTLKNLRSRLKGKLAD